MRLSIRKILGFCILMLFFYDWVSGDFYINDNFDFFIGLRIMSFFYWYLFELSAFFYWFLDYQLFFIVFGLSAFFIGFYLYFLEDLAE